ncbi:MAG TPA: hypothetical protein VGI61_05855 [Parafilimonas sp.]
MKYFLFVLLSVCFYVSSYSQSDVSTARWMQQPLIVDGKNTEWGSLNFYDDDTRLSFGIANDSNNIYLCFESADELNQVKIMRAGMKVTLSSKGKAKHDATIAFPLPQNNKQLPQQSNPANNVESSNTTYQHPVHDAASFRENFVTNHRVMNVSGFASANGEVPIDSITGLKAAINWDSTSNLYYEIAIAKKDFFGNDYSAKDAAADITLSVEINALQHSSNESSGSSGSGYHGGYHGNGGGMRGGNGMHGGYHSNNGNENNNEGGEERQNADAGKVSLSVKTSFKQKFVLNDNSSK